MIETYYIQFELKWKEESYSNGQSHSTRKDQRISDEMIGSVFGLSYRDAKKKQQKKNEWN